MEKYKLLARKIQLAANRQTSGVSAILILFQLRWWNEFSRIVTSDLHQLMINNIRSGRRYTVTMQSSLTLSIHVPIKALIYCF